MRIRKNGEPYKDLMVATDFSSIITPLSLLIMIFFTSGRALGSHAILLPHLSFADDEERVSCGALTDNVIRVAIMSLKGRERRGEMWTIWYDASDHWIFLIVHMDEQMEGSDLERQPELIMEEVLRKMSPPPKHLLVCWGRPQVAPGKRERWEERGHSEQDESPIGVRGGERAHVLYLRRKSMYWECLMTPLLIMMVWKFCRSMAQSLMSVSAERHTRPSRSEQNHSNIHH